MKWFKSPAKINRFLYIRGKLPDGYHEIVTLFEKITFFDEIGIEVKEDGLSRTRISGPDWLPKGRDNLVFQAVEAFRRELGQDFSVSIELRKRIPAGAGLGGGSSNCGTTLKALNILMGMPLSSRDLSAMAETMGADCPFFTRNWIGALGTGTGTRIEEVPLEPRWYLLVLPDFSVSTRWAYENFELTRQGDETIFEPRMVRSGYQWSNDLERPVCKRYPAISRVKETLMEAGAQRALMSGSGSTVFGVFDSKQQAIEAQPIVQGKVGYRCIVARTLEGEEFS